nr:160_t:CDS:1 [Entrophospora candida]
MDYQQWRDEYWEIFECFKTSSSLHHWILLVLIELKDSSEQTHFILEESLKDLTGEIEEILDNVQKSRDEHLKIISKCHDCILTPNDEDLRQSLLNEILPQAKLPNDWLSYLIQMTDSQRSFLRRIVYQNIQARLAFVRFISKTYLDPTDSESYHHTSNPYYRQIMNEKNEINDKYNDLLAKYNELLAKKNKQFEYEFEQINQRLLENREINTQILKNTQTNSRILENKISDAYNCSFKKYNFYKQESENIKIELINAEQKALNLQAALEDATNKLTNAEKNALNLQAALEDATNKLTNAEGKASVLQAKLRDITNESTITDEMALDVTNKLKNTKKKALNLQAALGDATNVCLSDESNNYLQLKKDIIKFKKLVEAFIKVKGKSTIIQIKEKAANKLLLVYKFKKDKDTFKDDLRLILQSIIIGKIFSGIEKITDRDKNGKFICLEAAIMNHTDLMIKCTTELSQMRGVDDHITKMTRQKIYETLELHGFNSDHPFINSIRNNIMDEMNKYREILDEDRRKNVSKYAEELVRSGIKLWFCSQIQEPVVNIEWYKPGKPVDIDFMEGPWEHNNANNSVVELCYFPCISSKGEEPEIYCKSQVTIRTKPKSWNIF